MTDEHTRPGRWQTFAGWHRTEQLWREIYTRTASALIAATVIYLVAAVSGVVSRKPLPWLALLGAALLLAPLVQSVRAMQRTGRPLPWSAVFVLASTAGLMTGYAILAWRAG